MGEESVFSQAGRAKTKLVAVRPSLRPIDAQKRKESDDLGQDGETASQEKVEGQEETEEEDEVQQPRVRRAPKEPTKAERERHEALHLPYREWCRHCVRGRGRNRPHRKQTGGEEENKVPRVTIDYFFMSKEEELASNNPLMVMIDEHTDNKYMRAVGQKGIGENGEMNWLIKDMHEELKSWGYPGGGVNELILKSDGENAIRAVREKLAIYHGGKITPEQPPSGESQSNGKVEEAGKTIRSMAKVFKDMIEDKIEEEINYIRQ